MKITELTLIHIGKDRGVRLPAKVIRRYGFTEKLHAELREDGLLLRADNTEKLGWEETASEMAASDENWNDWENWMDDGPENCPWDHPIPVAVLAWARKSAEREFRAKNSPHGRKKK